jgi:hypothetical protein
MTNAADTTADHDETAPRNVPPSDAASSRPRRRGLRTGIRAGGGRRTDSEQAGNEQTP